MKAHSYIATSLYGFIASKDGGLDWLNEANELFSERERSGISGVHGCR